MLASRLDEVIAEIEQSAGLVGTVVRLFSINPLKAQQAADSANGIINRSAQYVRYSATKYELDELQAALRTQLPNDQADLDRLRRLCRQVSGAVHNS